MSTPAMHDALRALPAVGRLLAEPRVRGWLTAHGDALVTAALRHAVACHRQRILSGAAPASTDAVLDTAEAQLGLLAQPALRPVINATGIVLHTGLGRAPLSAAAVEALVSAGGYCNLELDLADGTRGHRPAHVSALLCELTGAPAATVVNNNAAATLLILNTLVGGPSLGDRRRRERRPRNEVIVSRGQLVEIGGSFRLPDIMAASGARLVEVGTTNRTRIADYEHAVTERTAALMRVHSSNYRIAGFSEEASTAELVELGRRAGLPVIDDIGSGALLPITHPSANDEPLAAHSLAAGADVVCFSGDKLLGGPQAGLILGRADLVTAIERNPLMRTYRVDKLTLLALEATLRAYRDPDVARRHIPVLAQLHSDPDDLATRARTLHDLIVAGRPNAAVQVRPDESFAGGGTLPAQPFPTWVVRVDPPTSDLQQWVTQLRLGRPAIVARVARGGILFDLRTLSDVDLPAVAHAIKRLLDA